MTDLLVATGIALLVAAVAMTVTALLSRRLGKVSIVDVTWGLALVGVALALAVVFPSWLSWVVLALTAVWGLRLSGHILRRNRGKGEDPRYAAMLDGGGFRVAVRKVFVVQGAAVWLVSLPLQAAAVADVDWPWVVVAGVAVWLLGLAFEAVGDAQLAAYQREPRESRPLIMDRGLWGWTRHPNYFGDACIWWGLWLAGALACGWVAGLVTLPAPLMMTHFLRNVTGAALMERTMSQRPGWEEYAARTPYFVPRPPSR